MQMPFGKHKGERLDAIPSPYLWWVLDNCDSLKTWLRSAIEQELEDRGDGRRTTYTATPPPDRKPTESSLSSFRGIIGRWYRELTLRWHPDRGGSVEKQAVLNEAHDKLLGMMREVGIS